MTINQTAVWRIRPSGSNTNGGGFDASISGAGTDYSQQNAAQASGTAGTASGTAAFSDVVAANFTSAMVGNALYLTGTGFTAGWYFVVGYTSSSAVTLDRSPGTGTAGTWHLGGGWADITNLSSTGPVVPGNIVYMLGSGTPNPSSYTFDYNISSFVTLASGSTTAGYISVQGDPATPGFVSGKFGGLPVIKIPGLTWYNSAYIKFSNLFMVANGTSNANLGVIDVTNAIITNVYLDQNGLDIGLIAATSSAAKILLSQVFSSVVPGSAGSNFVVATTTFGALISYCNFYDTVGPGASLAAMATCEHSIFSRCRGDHITIAETSNPTWMGECHHNVIVGLSSGGGNGIKVNSSVGLITYSIYDNLISGITTSGKYGITVTGGTAASNTACTALCDYNKFYGNTTNYNNINAGPNDTILGSSPFQSGTDNYAVLSSLYGTGLVSQIPKGLVGSPAALPTSDTPGAIVPAAGSGTTYVINKTLNVFASETDYGP